MRMRLPLARHVVDQLSTMHQVVLRATSFLSLDVVFAQSESAVKRMCVCVYVCVIVLVCH